jgi:hypothetical protein
MNYRLFYPWLAIAFFLFSPMIAFGELADDGVESVLATASLCLDSASSATFLLVKEARSDGIYLTVRDANEKVLASSGNLGETDKFFTFDGIRRNLAVCDLDKDGKLEIITAVFYGPDASGLFVLNFNPKNPLLETTIPCRYEDKDAHPAFMVSDSYREDGADIVMSSNGSVRLLGRTFDKDASNAPGFGWYSFGLKNGAFHFLGFKQFKK